MPLRSPRTALVAALLAILITAAALRLYGLGARPFWLDEAYSAYAADHGWRFLWRVVPTYETHPPFYYSLLHVWRGLFGDGVLALRLPGALCGIATIGAAALAAGALADALGLRAAERRGLILAMAALAALHPDLLTMSRQVRPYPVMVLVYATALVPLLRIAATGSLRSRGALIGYAVCEALMLWLHSLGPLFAGAMGLALLAVIDPRRLSRADWLWLAGSQLAALLVWLPAALILRDQAPTWIASTWLVFKPAQFWRSIGLLYAAPRMTGRWLGLVLALVGIVLMLLRYSRTSSPRTGSGVHLTAGGTLADEWMPEQVRHDGRGWRVAVALLVLALVPTLASLAITLTVSPVFLTRTLSAVAMPALLLMAFAVTAGGWLRWAIVAPLAALLWIMGDIDRTILTAPPQEEWGAAARWVRDRAGPGDEVWAYPNESALPFAYAARDLRWSIRMRALPTIVPATSARGMRPTGSRGVVSLYPDDIARLAASRQACAPRTLWLLRTGPWTYDKGDLMLKALAARRVTVASWDEGPIFIVGLRRTEPCP